MKTFILGLSGAKESGKTTVSQCLKSWFKSYAPYEVMEPVAFADPLKRFLVDVMGLEKKQCHGSNADKDSTTKYFWDNLPLSVRMAYSNEDAEMLVTQVYPKEFGGLAHENERVLQTLPRQGRMTVRELMQVFGTDIMRNMFDDKIWVDATMRNIPENTFVVVSDVRFTSEVRAILQHPRGYIIRLLRKPHDDKHPSETELDNFKFANYPDRCLILDNQKMGIQETNEAVISFLKEKLKSADLLMEQCND